ncbi:SDR family oxidoreductase [Caenispirillum bisanense]|uniref:SDR family oxidoreductase n=1 Tax=Caenispirillum bisanense TaxID=414052 RepID=UPI0031D77CF0
MSAAAAAAARTVALVTGHSRGLGAALAESLLRRGVAVVGLARHGNDALAAAFPAQLRQVVLDLADVEAVTQWAAGPALSESLAGAERALLLNNAGVVQPIGPAGSLPPEAVARAVAVNVTAPLLLTEGFLAATAAAGCRDRRVMHISSGAARSAYAGWSVYCATKAALDHHARAVAADSLPGLRLCSMAPGVIDTDMQGEIRATPAERFPLLDRFRDLKAGGGLMAPEACAERLVEHLLGAAFGAVPVADLRTLAD